MLKERGEAIKRALMLLDGIVVSACFFVAYFLRIHLQDMFKGKLIPGVSLAMAPTSSINYYYPMLFMVVGLWCGFLYINGIYENVRTRSKLEVAWIILKTASYVGIGLGTLIFFFQLKLVSRLFFVIFLGVSFLAILTEKLTFIYVMNLIRKKGYNFERMLIVGTGRRAASFVDRIQSHPEWGLRIVGVLDEEPERPRALLNTMPVLGNLDNIHEIIRENAVDEVVFIVPRRRLNYIEKAVLVCETVGVKTSVAMDLFNLEIAKPKHIDIDGQPFVSFKTTVASESQLLVKRGIDLILSGLGMIVLGPALLIVAILIKLTSKGPVLFKQQRAGLNGRKFMLHKFRTMYEGSDRKRFDLEGLNEMNGPVFKIKRDPRVTPLGRILRKFSIDELPQLYDVFAGNMSLVGPRALASYEASHLDLWHRRRFSMRPGITCLWQVSGRNKLDFEEWMKLDLNYLDNWSLWLDMKILIRTIPTVLFGIGAY